MSWRRSVRKNGLNAPTSPLLRSTRSSANDSDPAAAVSPHSIPMHSRSPSPHQAALIPPLVYRSLVSMCLLFLILHLMGWRENDKGARTGPTAGVSRATGRCPPSPPPPTSCRTTMTWWRCDTKVGQGQREETVSAFDVRVCHQQQSQPVTHSLAAIIGLCLRSSCLVVFGSPPSGHVGLRCGGGAATDEANGRLARVRTTLGSAKLNTHNSQSLMYLDHGLDWLMRLVLCGVAVRWRARG